MSEEKNKDQFHGGVVNEPALRYAFEDSSVEETFADADYNFNDVDFGYARTIEELEMALDEADAEREDATKWITPVEFHTRIEDRFPWLR